jgi:hypothetical protein
MMTEYRVRVTWCLYVHEGLCYARDNEDVRGYIAHVKAAEQCVTICALMSEFLLRSHASTRGLQHARRRPVTQETRSAFERGGPWVCCGGRRGRPRPRSTKAADGPRHGRPRPDSPSSAVHSPSRVRHALKEEVEDDRRGRCVRRA